MQSNYDVIIVGGGPAGIFAALELSQAAGLKVLILEKGKDLDSRHCPILGKRGDCRSCSPCSSVSGLGGAGAFSDGKMTLSHQVGGHLKDYLGEKKSRELIRYVDNLYLRFGATDELYGVGERIEQISHKASLAELRLIPVPIRHLGTENCRVILRAMQSFLSTKVDIEVEKTAATILVDNGVVKGIETADGERLKCDI